MVKAGAVGSCRPFLFGLVVVGSCIPVLLGLVVIGSCRPVLLVEGESIVPSVGNFFSNGDQIPWCDSEVVAGRSNILIQWPTFSPADIRFHGVILTSSFYGAYRRKHNKALENPKSS